MAYYQYFYIKIQRKADYDAARKGQLTGPTGSGYYTPKGQGVVPSVPVRLQEIFGQQFKVELGFDLDPRQLEDYGLVMDFVALDAGTAPDVAERWTKEEKGGAAWAKNALVVLCRVSVDSV